MTDVNRIKRQMLRELVRENVDLKRGRLPRRLDRRYGYWRRLPRSTRAAVLSVVVFALCGSSWLVWARWSAPLQAPPGAALAAGLTLPAPGAARPHEPGLTAGPAVDASVFPVAVRRVVLDPGHGGDSQGTRAPLGLVEKDVALDIAGRLRRLLEADGFEVLMTRSEDQEMTLTERAGFANRSQADIFISIHLNWFEDRAARGVETYYLGPTNDPYLKGLAAVENRDSGHSMADIRPLLERIYAGVRQDNSRKLAESVQASLHRSLGKVSPGLDDRGVKAAPFIVLLDTEMPAILAEVACLSNDEEARLLTRPLYRQYIAEALAAGIRSYADAAVGAPAAKEAGEKGI
jgi:N-acetylmuramoyl-L-alanine amidase